MRAVLPAVAIAVLSGCAIIPPSQAPPCPAVRRAEAWINRMPGPQAPDQTLVIVLELETEERWMLREAASGGSYAVLALELRKGGAGHPGSAGYRSKAAGHPARVEILCNARLHHTINNILSVL